MLLVSSGLSNENRALKGICGRIDSDRIERELEEKCKWGYNLIVHIVSLLRRDDRGREKAKVAVV